MKKSFPKRYIFFFFVLLVYVVLFFTNRDLAWSGIIKTVQMLGKILPLLVFVFAVMVLSNIYFDTRRVRRHLGEDSGVRGWIYAMIFGILVSGPPYILFPLLQDLKSKGMKNSLLAVFLYNRNIKIPFLPAMIYYFGLEFTIILSFLIIIFSILNGILVGWLVRE